MHQKISYLSVWTNSNSSILLIATIYGRVYCATVVQIALLVSSRSVETSEVGSIAVLILWVKELEVG